jgi:HD superfamily phosphohydrolase YqeK
MYRIQILAHLVRDFYESHRETWIPAWTEYLYEHHIFFVAEEAKKLSEEFYVDGEFAIAASLLHDIADAILPRNHSEHTIESEKIALDLLTKA